jgi:hypothetical protein
LFPQRLNSRNANNSWKSGGFISEVLAGLNRTERAWPTAISTHQNKGATTRIPGELFLKFFEKAEKHRPAALRASPLQRPRGDVVDGGAQCQSVWWKWQRWAVAGGTWGRSRAGWWSREETTREISREEGEPREGRGGTMEESGDDGRKCGRLSRERLSSYVFRPCTTDWNALPGRSCHDDHTKQYSGQSTDQPWVGSSRRDRV